MCSSIHFHSLLQQCLRDVELLKATWYVGIGYDPTIVCNAINGVNLRWRIHTTTDLILILLVILKLLQNDKEGATANPVIIQSIQEIHLQVWNARNHNQIRVKLRRDLLKFISRSLGSIHLDRLHKWFKSIDQTDDTKQPLRTNWHLLAHHIVIANNIYLELKSKR